MTQTKHISTLSSSINNLSLDIGHPTIDDVHMLDQDIAQGINVKRHKYSDDPNFKGKSLLLNFSKKSLRSGHSISTCPNTRYTKPLEKPNIQKQTFNHAMKGNQKLPIKQITPVNMTGKPLPFSYRPRSNSRDNRDTSRHRSPNNLSHPNMKPYYRNNNLKPPRRNGSPQPRTTNHNKPGYNTNNTYSNNSTTKSPQYNSNENRPRQPFSHSRLRNVRNYINSLLNQELTDNTMSNTENTETQNVSEEQLLEQQFKDLLLELNHDTQDEYFNCQGECNTHIRIHSFHIMQNCYMGITINNIYTTNTRSYKNRFSATP